MIVRDDCLFCRMVAGEEPYHKVWEDEMHLAFLTIYPNTEGVTVVIPKTHYDSYIFAVPDEVMFRLMRAVKLVARMLDNAYEDVARTGLVFEGMAVNHLHAKLYPLHGTAIHSRWKPMHSGRDEYYEVYPGYISSHDSTREADEKLVAVAEGISQTLD
jgi:histidine triad (HIT) family protein